MATYRSDAPGLLPEQVGELFVEPMLAQSVATQVTTVRNTDSERYRIPTVQADPTTQWVAEGQEIALSEPKFGELNVRPATVAGLVVVSKELADDSNPDAAQEIADGLARDTALRVDEAFFGNLPSPAPAGLGSLGATVSTVYAGQSFTDLDGFAEAASIVEGVGATLTSWVANPSDLLTLAQLKTATGSNVPLLTTQPGQTARRIVEGLPVYSSQFVPKGTVWGIPSDRTFTIVRQDASIERDASPYFSSRRIGIRSECRIGFAYPHRRALVRVVVGPSAPPTA